MEKFMALFESIVKKKVSRRGFIKLCISCLALLPFARSLSRTAYAEPKAFNGRAKKGLAGSCDLVVARGEDPYFMTVKAVEAMGGMERFVKRDGLVVVKPNIGWDRSPAQAGNTNPQVVAALVELAYKAGARRVNVFDIPCNDARRCYVNSGIEKAAKEKGAHVFYADEWNVVEARFPYESPLEGWPILRDAIECDTFINVPVLKHHGLTNLTLSMKNLMGVCGGNRGAIHQGIGRKLVDLTDFMNPELTVIDAFKVLARNGPTGGDLRDVVDKRMVLVATDPTLADTYACTLVDVDPLSIPNIKSARDRKFGNSDIGRTNIVELTV